MRSQPLLFNPQTSASFYLSSFSPGSSIYPDSAGSSLCPSDKNPPDNIDIPLPSSFLLLFSCNRYDMFISPGENENIDLDQARVKHSGVLIFELISGLKFSFSSRAFLHVVGIVAVNIQMSLLFQYITYLLRLFWIPHIAAKLWIAAYVRLVNWVYSKCIG